MCGVRTRAYRGDMFSGAHVVIFSEDADADRAFFRDVLKLDNVDAGDGWLVFALPPTEAAFHPSDTNGSHEFYFMVDDVEAAMASLAEKSVACSDVEDQGWGLMSSICLPGGGEIGMYQPRYHTAVAED